jgi:putative nucleotidyltransferase with HDIG domain
MMKAPGTYNHSIVAANLAESAAELIGARPLLTRVGCYYHDVGKIKRPFFFVENQLRGENPHDHTNPDLSRLIITAHVKDGVELAKQNQLPPEIVDIIREHHGTSVVTYFFHRAQQVQGKEKVPESRFRYAGEKPQTKEAALVMLADCVEAAARTIHKPSSSRLEQLIKKIVRDKLEDGQLDESLLTMRDLEKITKNFVQGLTTIYHSRIVYPEGEVVPFKRGMPAHGSLNK